MASFSEKITAGFSRLCGRADAEASISDVPYPFVVEMDAETFMKLKIEGLYSRILRDCIKRSVWTHKDKDAIERSFYDCFENSENNCGLVGFIAKAMYARKSKTLVWVDGVLREATRDEAKTIKEDYVNIAKSDKGVIINFKDYELTQKLRLYFRQMYEVNMARSTAVNVAAALKIQIDKLREMVANSDADQAIKQARQIAEALKKGRAVVVDGMDKIEGLSSINTEPLIVARDEIYSEIAQDTGLPTSYISGVATTGASVIGDADINREAEGIEPYWLSIWKPIVTNLYGIQSMGYRTDKWRALESKVRSVSMIETLDTLTEEEKREFAAKTLELDNAPQDEKQKV